MNRLQEFVAKFCSYEKISYPVEKRGRRYYSVSPELLEVEKSIDKGSYSSGLFLGEEGKFFTPSVVLLDWIAPHTTQKVWVDEKVGWLFVCGKDVFWDSVIRKKADDSIVLVMSEKDEVLGVGQITRKKGKKIVLNTFDRGSFLRRERN